MEHLTGPVVSLRNWDSSIKNIRLREPEFVLGKSAMFSVLMERGMPSPAYGPSLIS